MKTNHANWDYHNTRVEMAEKEACFLEEGAAAFLEEYAAALDALRIEFPHTRGGEPVLTLSGIKVAPVSPHTWG